MGSALLFLAGVAIGILIGAYSHKWLAQEAVAAAKAAETNLAKK